MTVAAALAASAFAAHSRAGEPADADAEFFEREVRPVLAEHCQACHGPEKSRGGLRLDSRAAALAGGDSGPGVVPGEPAEGLLLEAVGYGSDLKMPPRGKLPPRALAALDEWVRRGAPWPGPGGDEGATPAETSTEAGAPAPDPGATWAFRPPAEPEMPGVAGAAWPRSPIDRFVLARLESEGLRPAPEADRRTLLRRATFDLTGLPPTPEEVDAFLADESPDAYEKAVDRLLASPRYGERWGRHWLDLARYADSNGMDENVAMAHAWRYRDYVIDAFNRDVPYDRFVREQIAGDLLPETPDPIAAAIATGFLVVGPKMLAEDDPVKMEMDIVDEQVDTVGKVFLGLTLGCARCHDHKFDPIPTADYYALAGIFKSTKTMANHKVVAMWHERPLDPGRGAGPRSGLRAGLEAEGVAAPMTPAVEDQREPADLAVHVRGSHLSLGEVVPRRFPRALAGDGQPAIPPGRSGRRELADWIASPGNPLTARVMVNRIWMHHFGRGLVDSVDNFGALGERPSHPELLDWLALRFVEDGWSIKAMHRRMMLTATYRMGSDHDSRAAEVDPENRLHWRRSRRRLEAEAIRDALLAVGPGLDPARGGTLLPTGNHEYVNSTVKDTGSGMFRSARRSVYLPVIRSGVFPVLQAFDFVDPGVSTGRRESTTVAPQALFFLNDALAIGAAEALAGRLLSEPAGSDAERVGRAYQLAYSRPPTGAEVDRALGFVARFEAALADRGEADPAARRARAWRGLCQAVLASNEFSHVD